MMKKVMFAMMIAVLMGCVAQAAEKIKDVAPDDWAAKSIQKMVDEGYIALYGDEFQGSKSVSRKEFAVALAKLVDQLESGQFKAGGEDIKALKQMGEELNSNISKYDTRLAKLESRFTDISNDKVAIQIDLTKSVGEFRDNYDTLKSENEKLRQQLAELDARYTKLINDMDTRLTAKDAELDGDIKVVSKDLTKEGQTRQKKDTSNLIVGILALVAGVAVK